MWSRLYWILDISSTTLGKAERILMVCLSCLSVVHMAHFQLMGYQFNDQNSCVYIQSGAVDYESFFHWKCLDTNRETKQTKPWGYVHQWLSSDNSTFPKNLPKGQRKVTLMSMESSKSLWFRIAQLHNIPVLNQFYVIRECRNSGFEIETHHISVILKIIPRMAKG